MTARCDASTTVQCRKNMRRKKNKVFFFAFSHSTGMGISVVCRMSNVFHFSNGTIHFVALSSGYGVFSPLAIYDIEIKYLHYNKMNHNLRRIAFKWDWISFLFCKLCAPQLLWKHNFLFIFVQAERRRRRSQNTINSSTHIVHRIQ